MINIAVVFVLAFTTVIGGANSHTDQQGGSGLVALTDTQIAFAYSGQAVGHYEVVVGGGPPIFCPNGTFYRFNRRRVYGNYQIEAGRICTQVKEIRPCKYVFRDSSGAIFESLDPDGAHASRMSFSTVNCNER